MFQAVGIGYVSPKINTPTYQPLTTFLKLTQQENRNELMTDSVYNVYLGMIIKTLFCTYMFKPARSYIEGSKVRILLYLLHRNYLVSLSRPFLFPAKAFLSFNHGSSFKILAFYVGKVQKASRGQGGSIPTTKAFCIKILK